MHLKTLTQRIKNRDKPFVTVYCVSKPSEKAFLWHVVLSSVKRIIATSLDTSSVSRFVETHRIRFPKHSYCLLLSKLSRHCQRLQTWITSDENARWLIGLVKKVPVDGQQGSTHDATPGWRDSRHLWAQIFECSIKQFLKERTSLRLTYLHKFGSWRAFPYPKPWISSCLVNS